MTQKKTAWFPASTKPARVGVYQTILLNDYGNEIQGAGGFSRFNRNTWKDTRSNVQLASECQLMGLQSKIWRGLTKETK